MRVVWLVGPYIKNLFSLFFFSLDKGKPQLLAPTTREIVKWAKLQKFILRAYNPTDLEVVSKRWNSHSIRRKCVRRTANIDIKEIWRKGVSLGHTSGNRPESSEHLYMTCTILMLVKIFFVANYPKPKAQARISIHAKLSTASTNCTQRFGHCIDYLLPLWNRKTLMKLNSENTSNLQ